MFRQICKLEVVTAGVCCCGPIEGAFLSSSQLVSGLTTTARRIILKSRSSRRRRGRPVRFIDDAHAPVPLDVSWGRGGEGAVSRSWDVFCCEGLPCAAERLVRKAGSKMSPLCGRQPLTLLFAAAGRNAEFPDEPPAGKRGESHLCGSEHRQVHHLYSPAHAKDRVPERRLAFSVHVARNCAAGALDSIHAAGHVVRTVPTRSESSFHVKDS